MKSGSKQSGFGKVDLQLSKPQILFTLLLCHPQHTVITDHSLSASHMETTMKLLKTRVQSRLALHKQFASLGKWC